jgi:hypothetical protein
VKDPNDADDRELANVSGGNVDARIAAGILAGR